jgi:hypothetical protein
MLGGFLKQYVGHKYVRQATVYLEKFKPSNSSVIGHTPLRFFLRDTNLENVV